MFNDLYHRLSETSLSHTLSICFCQMINHFKGNVSLYRLMSAAEEGEGLSEGSDDPPPPPFSFFFEGGAKFIHFLYKVLAKRSVQK